MLVLPDGDTHNTREQRPGGGLGAELPSASSFSSSGAAGCLTRHSAGPLGVQEPLGTSYCHTGPTPSGRWHECSGTSRRCHSQ